MYEGKLIAASMVFRHFPLGEAMKQVKAHGFDEMEITSAGLFTPHFLNLEYLTEYEMDKKADEARQIGIHVHALNINSDPAGPVEHYAQHLNAFRLASRYGAEIVTVGCGNIPEGTDTVSGLKGIAGYLNEMSLIAWNEYGIRLSVEAPHRNTCSEKMEQIQTFWAYMPERIQCTMDVAHATYAGASIEKILNIVKYRLAHVHLRDAVRGNSMVPYGQGSVDFAEVFRLLDRAGYKGKCSLEFPSGEKMEDALADFEKGIEILLARRAEAFK